jgi:ParB family chromosome partitioning protein
LEIAENLHREESTALERGVEVGRWMVLTEQRISVHVAPKVDRKRGRPEGSISAAARELGIESTDAKRAVKAASLSEEAKEAARLDLCECRRDLHRGDSVSG